MAEVSKTGSAKPAAAVPARECCSEYTYAYVLLRFTLAALLIFAGLEKFKAQGANGWFYSLNNWHQVKDPNPALKDDPKNKMGRWFPVTSVIFDNSGLNKVKPTYTQEQLDQIKADGEEPDEKGLPESVVNGVSWGFYYFGHALPWAMLGTGALILIGFLNRLALWLGGMVWLSLAVGQMMLPDNATVQLLITYVALHAIAISLVRYNRLALTRY